MRKAISLVLVFSILLLSGTMFAKERKGADLVVQKTDGTQVRGELIAVKENSLLLMERDSGADVTVKVEDIRALIVVKKSQFLVGAGLGLLIGGGAGAGIGSLITDPNSFLDFSGAYALFGGVLLGILIGGLVGLEAGKDKIIQIEGKSDLEINAYVKELRKKARVKNAQ